jgi:hypothetical protein
MTNPSRHAADHLFAPFTDTELRALNDYQRYGMMHPFTCGSEGCREELVALRHGWRCCRCGYEQNWAHRWMATTDWRTIRAS